MVNVCGRLLEWRIDYYHSGTVPAAVEVWAKSSTCPSHCLTRLVATRVQVLFVSVLAGTLQKHFSTAQTQQGISDCMICTFSCLQLLSGRSVFNLLNEMSSSSKQLHRLIDFRSVIWLLLRFSSFSITSGGSPYGSTMHV